MSQQKHSKKIILTAVEISDISISLRENVRRGKASLRKAKQEDIEGIKEYLEKTAKLQKRFQHLAVQVENEVLKEIKDSA
ncbi:MAG: hypothetical protein Q7S88_00010 [Candidatus Daviesbacteria bacterium]|nr:hypothetical protein [Candidatus Daviesbacteria bacterium]